MAEAMVACVGALVRHDGPGTWRVTSLVDGMARITRLAAMPRHDRDEVPVWQLTVVGLP